MVVIRTDRLTRRFGDLVAADVLSVDVPCGGVTGLVGPNGSGKSTLIRMLLDLIRPSSGTADVLGIVGLMGREQEPVKRFSLGMKQRLGIAAALLPDPQVLVLDEPTNGLDPAGIVKIRGLLQTLGESGRSVIVSWSTPVGP